MISFFELVVALLFSILAFQLGSAAGDGSLDSSISWFIPGLLAGMTVLGFIIHRRLVVNEVLQRIDQLAKQEDQPKS